MLHGGWGKFGLFLLVAVLLQAAGLGDTNRHADETFYFLVGQRMHDGLLPYVDVWDRKPPGLFLIYWIIAGLSRSVLAYQSIACLFAALTAAVIARIAVWLAGNKRAWLAGLAYLLAIVPFEGGTGQAPDFYNLAMASAVWLILQDGKRLEAATPGWRTWTAMLLCGVAITIKQTTAFESLFVGGWVLFCQRRAGAKPVALLRTAALCALAGLLPMLVFAGWYAWAGHWAEFWHAMVTSNLVKQPHTGKGMRLTGSILKALVVLIPALWVLLMAPRSSNWRAFMAAWFLAALAGYLAVPNFYPHYALPLMVPLAVLAGIWMAGTGRGAALVALLLCNAALWVNLFDPAPRRLSNQSMVRLSAAITQHDGGGDLLVYDGPVYLYALTGKRLVSPLTFPHHLSHAIERNVSHLDTNTELDRILAAKPGVIVISQFPRNIPVNVETRTRVLAYARSRCAWRGMIDLYEAGSASQMVVFGDCRDPKSNGA